MLGSRIMSRPVDRVFPAVDERDAANDKRDAAKRFFVVLTAITAVALAWRIFYDIHERGRIIINGDAAYYHWEANLVAKGYGFIDPTRYELFGLKTPSAGHPPPYIVYLAA